MTPLKLPQDDTSWEKNTPYLFNDIPIIIEYLAGDIRTKVTSTGMVIENEMPCAYGYILNTTDAHGEEIDCYIANLPDKNACVYVIDQINPQTKFFDEHKVMFGFSGLAEVLHTYYMVFSDGSGEDRVGFINSFDTINHFKNWLEEKGSAFKPVSSNQMEGLSSKEIKGITPGVNPKHTLPKERDTSGGVLIELPDLSKGPQFKILSDTEGKFHYHFYIFSPLDHMKWSNAVDLFCRTLTLAEADDTIHVHIASPGGSVLLMGRMISSINETQAKVITYAEGGVASAATSIWASGHERHILPGAFFMQHMSSQLLTGKTTEIAAVSAFCVDYIKSRLDRLIESKLFTQEEVSAMINKSSDIFISGREAINRVGQISYTKRKES